MEKKWLVLILIFLFVVAITSYLVYISKQKVPETINQPYYSDDPKTWIADKGDGIQEIDVEKVSKGRVYLSNDKLQFNNGQFGQVFVLNGVYNGEEFFPEYPENSKTILKISPEMNPEDGIMEGYIVEDIIDDSLVAYIFLDQDWKDKISKTNIIWGSSYENIKQFNFNEIKKGIYMDKISDDRDRFDNDFALSKGGIIVGNLTMENIDNLDMNNVLLIELY